VTAWRSRPLRARVADVALVGAILVVGLAIVTNAPATIRDTKRSRLDQKVLRHYLKAHPELGSFGAPLTMVHQKVDVACAFRRHTTAELCVQIDSRTMHSRRILTRWNCLESPKPVHAPWPGPGDRYCPIRRGKAI
jgi:hypothetical protein